MLPNPRVRARSIASPGKPGIGGGLVVVVVVVVVVVSWTVTLKAAVIVLPWVSLTHTCSP